MRQSISYCEFFQSVSEFEFLGPHSPGVSKLTRAALGFDAVFFMASREVGGSNAPNSVSFGVRSDGTICLEMTRFHRSEGVVLDSNNLV
jgi:hypothetical protein